MFKTDPCKQGDTEYEVEQSLVGYREYDKCRRECEEYDNQSVQIMAVWVYSMHKRKNKRGDYSLSANIYIYRDE